MISGFLPFQSWVAPLPLRLFFRRLELAHHSGKVGRRGEVPLLRGIGGQVIDLLDGLVDEFEVVADEPRKGGGAHRQVRGHGFEVDQRLQPLPAGHEGQERFALELGRKGKSDDVADRREDIDVAGIFADRRGEGARPINEQRHVEGIVVGEEAVPELLFLAQGLAVVGRDDDDGLLEGPAFFERVKEAAELRIDESDLARIGVGGVLRPERLGRRIGVVGIEDMDPAEPLLPLGPDPIHGRRDHLVGRPLDDVEILVLGDSGVVVIEVEAFAEPEPGVEDEGADEGGRLVVSGFEDLGHGLVAVFQLESGIIADPMIERRRSGQDVRVGGAGQGSLGISVDDQGGTAGQGVEVRGPDVPVGQDPQPVVAERVDGDEKDVRVFRHCGIRRRSPDRAQHEDERGQRPERHLQERSHIFLTGYLDGLFREIFPSRRRSVRIFAK